MKINYFCSSLEIAEILHFKLSYYVKLKCIRTIITVQQGYQKNVNKLTCKLQLQSGRVSAGRYLTERSSLDGLVESQAVRRNHWFLQSSTRILIPSWNSQNREGFPCTTQGRSQVYIGRRRYQTARKIIRFRCSKSKNFQGMVHG